MKSITLVCIAAIAALAVPAFAHPEHDTAAPAAAKSIAEKAQDAVLVQITRAKLNPSWRKATPGKAEASTVKGVSTWVVPFRSEGGKTLLVTLDSDGGYLNSTVSNR